MSSTGYIPFWRTWVLQAIKDYEKAGEKKKVADGKKALSDLDWAMQKKEELEDSLFERGVD